MIGIGSRLRNDDAAGRAVADRVERLRLPGVRVRSVDQLVPELVEDLARCARAVFVDADPASTSVRLSALVPAPAGTRATHHTTPGQLLTLAETVGARVPRAILLAVPATDLGLGTALSGRAARGVRAAVTVVAAMARACGHTAPGARRRRSPARPLLPRPRRLAGLGGRR